MKNNIVDVSLLTFHAHSTASTITNVVSRVSLLPSYTADKINRFKLGALLQKDRDHKGYDGYP